MKEIFKYLKENVDDEVILEKWDAKLYLPIVLVDSYEFFLVKLLSEKFLLIRPQELQQLQRVQTHITMIREKAGLDVAVLLDSATPYITKRMLSERIAFISVDKQMYLPFLGLQIKKQKMERFYVDTMDKFTASTQLVYLALLYSAKEVFAAEELALELELSTMTVLRACNKLKQIGVLNFEIGGQTGRKKVFTTIDKKEFYRIGKGYLINPVKQIVDVERIPEGITIYKGGLTALGEQTILGEPKRQIFATFGNSKEVYEIRALSAHAILENLPRVQIMKYDIGKLTKNSYIDPVTLILSLKETDERIDMAIEELMEEFEWFEA